jgi:hypothetical protein
VARSRKGKGKGRAKTVTAKKSCCKSRPRCKRCPAVLKRLEREGHAEKVGRGEYVLIDVTKKVLTRARTRPTKP